jgi:hypothetical protein
MVLDLLPPDLQNRKQKEAQKLEAINDVLGISFSK